MGVPEGSWICRKEIASSVETAGTSLTGMRTRERRRLPDQSEGGAMTQTRTAHKKESESGLGKPKRKVNKMWSRQLIAAERAAPPGLLLGRSRVGGRPDCYAAMV